MSTTFIALGAIFLYLFVGIRLALRLSKGKTAIFHKEKWLALGMAAILLHAWVLYQHLFVTSGVNFGFFNAVSLLMSLIALIVLLSAFTRPVESLGIVVLPMAALALTLEQIFPTSHILQLETFRTLEVHILISILAYSLFSIAAGQALLLAIQDRHLRTRHPGGFIRALPPLETMETMLFQIITAGFVLQSLSLISGFIFLENMFAQHLVHKTVLSILAWLVFATLLIGRWRLGWRGRKAIRWTLMGFITLLLAYLGSKLVLELILKR